jgi:hypothetical protein
MRTVWVDGVNKGEVSKRAGRWFWHRAPATVDPFPRGALLTDVAEWARKCCNGKHACVRGPRISFLRTGSSK